MQRVRNVFLAAAGVIVLAACSSSGAPEAGAESAVRAVNAAWFKAYAAGDAAGVAARYAEDAVVSPPGAPAARGGAAILEYFTQDIATVRAAGLSFVADPATDVGVSGDLAWETGQFTVTDTSGATVEIGKFSTVFARRDGSWKIIRDTWNSNAVPAAGGAGSALRIVYFTAASAEAQQAALKLVDEEINSLYASAQGLQWIKYFVDTKTLQTGSVSLWSSAADAEAFLNSEGYKPIPGKLKPLMKGAMTSQIVEVRAPSK